MEYLSEKLKALSLCAIILVVFIHSYNGEVKFASGEMMGGQGPWVLFLENFVSKGIARIAVPFFFAISGYLFYLNYDFTFIGTVEKLKRRFRSLVIPYLFWSIYGLVLLVILQSIPWSEMFFTGELLKNYSFSKLLSTILVDPIPYQLWFLRDLIMLVIFSPLIGYLTKSINGVLLVILGFLWMVTPKTLGFFSNEALLFFTLGCALAFDKSGLMSYQFSKLTCYSFLAAWLVIVFSTTYLLTFEIVTALYELNNLGVLAGLLAVWSVYDWIGHGPIARYSVIFGYTFIIFVFHEPLLTILIKGLFFWWGKNNFTSLVIYVIAPLVAIGISIFVRYVMRRLAPRLYDFTTGGR